MKRAIILPMVVMALVTLSCAFLGNLGRALQAEATPVPLPTGVLPMEPTPTLMLPSPQPTSPPPPMQSPEPPRGGTYFVEEFDGSVDDWSYNILSGNEKNIVRYQEGGRMVVSLPDPGAYVYFFNESYTYGDIYVQARYENLGDNNNGVTLICRRNPKGWYEFRVGSNGRWSVYRFDQSQKDRKRIPYTLLAGTYSSIAINAGVNKLNNIGMKCVGNEIRLFINGEEIIQPNKRPILDNEYTEGHVGFAIISEGASRGVLVEMDYVGVDAP
ncbi:MAG: hypothetical protein U1B80_10140 [Anaerolineaceae bacterium]|nr:hypothetical protein [Anaerolineaceae bacterium]